MPRSLHRFALPALLLALWACPAAEDAGEAPDSAPQPTVTLPEAALSPAEVARAVEVGGAAAGQLATTLIQHLTTALSEGGPEGAIGFCATEAMPLTAEVNASLDGPEVKRTSTRIRNPANRPDSLESLALEWFAVEMASSNTVPAHWVQPGGNGVARFYRPLVINEMCLQCHGPVESLSPAVAAVLAERYPDDEATGYGPGDLRGLIRVTVPAEGGAR